MWAIVVKYLRGVCVATDSGQRDKVEWPPHESRLFMALAATYFETCEVVGDETAPERRALEWLEQQPAPRVFASDASVRTAVTVYVPVNDSTSADQLLEDQRSRQPRHFPTTIPDNDEVIFVWDGSLPEDVRIGLGLLALNVSRLGHSSSLVQVWVDDAVSSDSLDLSRRGRHEWRPTDNTNATVHFRVIAKAAGTLKNCESNYNLAAIESFVEWEDVIKSAKGREKKMLKERFAEQFPNGEPRSVAPPNSLSVGYSRVEEPGTPCPTTIFDNDMMVLSIFQGLSVYLDSTLQVAGAFRKKIHDAFVDRKSPAWLSGHETDGSVTKQPHMAILPLPFVGDCYADGHLLGVALAFPREISTRDRALALKDVFKSIEFDGEAVLGVELDLKGQRKLSRFESSLVLVREDRLTPPISLRSQVWTRCCSVWESVTPIVLDRFPKKDRIKDRSAWRAEVGEIISQSCENIGLPKPWQVHVHHNPFLSGVPKARPQGGGYPLLQGKGKGAGFQVHARIEFAEPVQGPISLGAGRFVGYGFCRPNTKRCAARRNQK